jgi:hypothetical protein
MVVIVMFPSPVASIARCGLFGGASRGRRTGSNQRMPPMPPFDRWFLLLDFVEPGDDQGAIDVGEGCSPPRGGQHRDERLSPADDRVVESDGDWLLLH